MEFWQSVKDSETAEEIRIFLDTYPNSVFAPLARLRLERLNTGDGVETQSTDSKSPATVKIPPIPPHKQIGYAGFQITHARTELAELAATNFRPKYLVTKVIPYGHAVKAGLLKGDIIISVNGDYPPTAWDLVKKLRAVAPGKQIRLEVERAGKTLFLDVTSGDRFALNWNAAHSGNGFAMASLAEDFRYGLTIDRDQDQANLWIHDAGSSNHPYALYLRGVFAEHRFSEEASDQEAEATALAYYLRAGEAGMGYGYTAASKLIAKSDPERALRFASQAFAIDQSQGALALYLRMKEQDIETHKGTTQNEILKLAVEFGSIPASRDLGLLYVNENNSAHLSLGLGLLRRAADHGDTIAQRELGKLYKTGTGVGKNRAEAFAWFLKAAESGDSKAQAEVGRAYYFGRGTEKDIDKAYSWFKRASDNNNAVGHFYMGYLTGRGDGTEKNNGRAVEFYHRAAELGHKDAMTNLGIRYQAGRGVEKDLKQAAHWYQRAMDAGALNAHSGVGYMYRHGRGGYPKDPEKAVEVFRAAADQGNASGQYNLGLMYEVGEGVIKDIDEAVRLYRLAAGREKRAKKALARLGLPLFDSAEIQQLLAELGYDPGPIDGKPATRTRSAVRAFQEDQNINADGKLDVALLNQLRNEVKRHEAEQTENNQTATTVISDLPTVLTPEQETNLERLEDALDF